MRLGLVLLVLWVSVAEARRPPPPPDLPDPFARGVSCDRGDSWAKVQACLERDGAKVTVRHDVPGAKLAAIVTKSSPKLTTLVLYIQRDTVWQATTFRGLENETNELLGFQRIGAGYRIDQGAISRSSVGTGIPGFIIRLWLRRQTTTVCSADTAMCRSIVTACDAMIDGKARWSFRGTLRLDNKQLFVTGDASRAGTICAPIRSVFRDEPVGDPLE